MRTIRPLGHQPNLAALRSDLHQLLAIFLASKSIAEVASEEAKPVASVFNVQDIENDAITRLLLATSVTLRVLDDREDGRLEMFSVYCGTLTKDTSDPVASGGGLTLREACNKIIHATEVELDRSSLHTGHSYLNPYVYLSGKDQRSRDWQVSLKVAQFVREGLVGISLIA